MINAVKLILCVCAALSQQDPEWYALLTSRLSPEQTVQVQELFTIADKRAAARGMWYCHCQQMVHHGIHIVRGCSPVQLT